MKRFRCFRRDIVRFLGTAGIVLSVTGAGLIAGCGRGSEPATQGDEPDYRALIERSRKRQEASARYKNLEQGIRDFHVLLGRFPTNLNEVVRAGFIDVIPEPPPGTGYAYDPVSGTFRIMRLPPDGQQQQRNPPAQ